uniref:Cation/H+ exchanger transmembrane domain-containing protein n=1 Tax=Bionectria ochroleuca TaxID=29856 RepID=A0A8H7N2Z7_BIOOC
MESSLSYHEPSVVIIAILSGFLLLTNVVNYGLDKIAYCGLIGQVAIGMAWGTPGGKLLDSDIENAVMQLGYLGLILLVFEGGLATSFKTLKANIVLSSGVALTGIAVPMGFSFLLQSMVGASSLQAFAAGAALCSTSLGTTFTILGTSGLSSTRLGVVLTSAAMMDDVVGLIVVQIVSNLGNGGDFNAVTVVRPIMVSIAFALLVPIVSRFVVIPVTLKLNEIRVSNPTSNLALLLKRPQTALVTHTLLLLGLVIGGTYSGTSSLLAAYIAGAAISWWDSEVDHPNPSPETNSTGDNGVNSATQSTSGEDQIQPGNPISPPVSEENSNTSGMSIYETYYRPAVERVLKPFFFASIGFSIPITKMFSGSVIWRGIIYTILMIVGKLLCGAWLVPFGSPLQFITSLARRVPIFDKLVYKPSSPGSQCANSAQTTDQVAPTQSGDGDNHDGVDMNPLPDRASQRTSAETRNSTPNPKQPKSVYPACIVGLGMVARGEIGFLVAALAESKGIFGRPSGSSQPSELFLVVTWAISLCTVIGPICVGLLVNRVKRLETLSRQGSAEGRANVLGAWGVI